ncbi:GNAT family N-acetyltransferase [Devosia sp. MC532]|uniref:GNAT family N-acetyltransferase n=1 Tax=Devosia sp. MC532 TaxID=2799788 RepID=UPI0018F5C934|nr:GNAT family N-acetyltransferase [Devosia sp. MC532]MBJ7579221.1 GNAT family N-acetyltransferase [Devosia sp. MC532]
MTILIRPARISDRIEIAKLHIEVGASTYRGIMSDHYLDVVRPKEKAQLWINRLAEGVQTSNFTLLVADNGDELVGFIFFELELEQDHGTYLHHLYIAPNYQGRGLGLSLLVDGIAALPQDHQAVPIHLVALAANTRAIAFYEKLNGRVIEKTARPQDDGPDVALARYQWKSAAALAQAALDRSKI